MPNIFKGSLVTGFIVNICKTLILSYKGSRLRSFVNQCSLCLKNSFTYNILRRYFYKPAYFEYSLTYRLILWLVKIFDVPMALLNRGITYLIRGSLFADTFKKITEAKGSDRLVIFAVALIYLSCGCTVGLLLKGGGLFNLYLSIGLFALALVILIISRLTPYIKDSLVYRLINWFVKE